MSIGRTDLVSLLRNEESDQMDIISPARSDPQVNKGGKRG